VIHLRNDDAAQRKYFYLNYVPHLPDGWTVNLNNGVFGMELAPGQMVTIPIVIQSGGSVTATVGDVFRVDVGASSQRMLVNALDPMDTHVEFKPLGGVTIQAYVLQPTRLACQAAETRAPNYPFIWGRLDGFQGYLPPTGQGLPIFLEGVDAGNNFLPQSAQIVYTDQDGRFFGHLSDVNQRPLKQVICLFAGTDMLASASSGFVDVAQAQRVAYVYNSQDAAMSFFYMFLSNNGLSVDTVPLATAGFFDFSPDTAIIVAGDTGGQGMFFSAGAADAIRMSGKPVLGLGEGGAALFEHFGLNIGYGHTWYAGDHRADVVDSRNRVWAAPNPLSVATGDTLSLYGADGMLAVYLPSPLKGVTPVGRQTGDAGHYPLIAQSMNGVCDALWGFTGAPGTMTSQGKDLFLNMLLGPSCQTLLYAPVIVKNY